MLNNNIILATDSYKASHFKQYPEDATNVFSYIEARKNPQFNKTVFFGLQMFLNKLEQMRVTRENVEEAKIFFKAHGLPFNEEGWNYIVEKYDGRLPIVINAAKEGSVIPTGNALVTVMNTDEKLPWLTSYLETALLRSVWYPTTVATVSWNIKQTIKQFLEWTAYDSVIPGILPFRLHDFGARGVSSAESAEIGGAAHIVNFMGSDTVEGVWAAMKHYGGDMPAFSIPAAEHSTITAWGPQGEVDAYRNMLNQFAGPGKLVAVVSDSYDLMNAVNNIWAGTLKEEVKNNGGIVVIRPDSGDPVKVVTAVLECLAVKFGYKFNSKGYAVLPDYVRVIQGDGINHQSIKDILSALMEQKISAENIAFGMGGALLQQVNRDTCNFAMKASAVKRGGVWHDIRKAPATDPGKASKGGRLALIREAGVYQTVPLEGSGWRNELVNVFHNGHVRNRTTFAEVRERAQKG